MPCRAGETFSQRFTIAANERDVHLSFIGDDSRAGDRSDAADTELIVIFDKVLQRWPWLRGVLTTHAAAFTSTNSLARFHGSSSAIRLIG